MLAGSFDSTVIDQIVSEVLTQLRQRAGSNSSTGQNGQQTGHSKPQREGVELTDAVITAETLKKKAEPGGIVHISPKAILTPSARDYLRELKVQVVQGTRNTVSQQKSSKHQGVVVASHLPSVVQTFLDELKKQHSSSWKVEIESGTSPVIERARSIICRGESSQVLIFVKQPHRVACSVNRNSQCRAAVVHRGGDVQTVRNEMGANILCIDLEQPSYMELRKIFRAVTETSYQVQAPSES